MNNVNFKPRDRDFILTKDGLIFCVVGYVHPEDRIISYLKYVPNNLGKWKRAGENYYRVIPYYSAPQVAETFNFLEHNYPKYLFYSKYDNITFTAVPLADIEKYFRADLKLRSLKDKKNLDTLEYKAVRLVNILAKEAGVPFSDFGITGSILLGMHNPDFSDIDLIVYGAENVVKVKEAIKKLKMKNIIHNLSERYKTQWIQNKIKVFQLTSEDAGVIFERTWNIGIFDGVRFSLHPVRKSFEIKRFYGQYTYLNRGEVEIIGEISDNSEAYFNPSLYGLSRVKVIKGPNVTEIRELVSYEGVYCDTLNLGDRLRIRGKLEEVRSNLDKTAYYRIVLGASELNYSGSIRFLEVNMKPIK
ncbi:MAG: nucleotidyltransferase domain-containing protein [Candidatus Odinarchaeia archaeon]